MPRDTETVFKLRSELRGDHVHTTVFVGPKGLTLANCGTIVTRVDRIGEWQSFGAALKLGAAAMDAHVEVVFEGDEEIVARLDGEVQS